MGQNGTTNEGTHVSFHSNNLAKEDRLPHE